MLELSEVGCEDMTDKLELSLKSNCENSMYKTSHYFLKITIILARNIKYTIFFFFFSTFSCKIDKIKVS